MDFTKSFDDSVFNGFWDFADKFVIVIAKNVMTKNSSKVLLWNFRGYFSAYGIISPALTHDFSNARDSDDNIAYTRIGTNKLQYKMWSKMVSTPSSAPDN